jgi:hypothetical protein
VVIATLETTADPRLEGERPWTKASGAGEVGVPLSKSPYIFLAGIAIKLQRSGEPRTSSFSDGAALFVDDLRYG